MQRLRFNEMSDVIVEKFDETKYKNFSRLCVDTAKGTVKQYSIEEANDKIRKTIIEMAGLSESPTPNEVRKAFKKQSVREAVFEVIEETVEDTLVSGWTSSPVFQKYVEVKTLALGQKNKFYTKDPCIITVAEIADGHHSIERQRLGAGKEFGVSVKSYGAKVYMEMSRFLQGVEDWSELINKIAEAFTRLINTLLHEAVMSAGTSLPVPAKWNIRGELNAANHDKFVKLISDVQLATGGVATIVGTKVALAGLKNLGDIQWVSEAAKNDVYNTGRIGTFEGTQIIELPQAFKENDVEHYLEDDTKLLILPSNIDKFVKMYYEGMDETKEVSESGDNADDTKEYEFKSRFGIKTMTNTRFGTWTIGA